MKLRNIGVLPAQRTFKSPMPDALLPLSALPPSLPDTLLTLASAGLPWLVPLALGLCLAGSPWGRALLGRARMRALLHTRLSADEYATQHHVTVTTGDAQLQWDHVVISRYGIFALAIYPLAGRVGGGAAQAEWTQATRRHTRRVTNPLRQGYEQTTALARLLKVPAAWVHPVVVGVGAGRWQPSLPVQATSATGALRYIESAIEPVFSAAEAQGLLDRLQALQQSGAQTRPPAPAVRGVRQTARYALRTPPASDAPRRPAIRLRDLDGDGPPPAAGRLIERRRSPRNHLGSH